MVVEIDVAQEFFIIYSFFFYAVYVIFVCFLYVLLYDVTM